MNRLLATIMLCASLALAGCAAENDETDPPTTTTPVTTTPVTTTPVTTTPVTTTPVTPTPDANETEDNVTAESYALAVAGVPAQVEVGKRFNFTLYVNGTPVRTSDHIGAHAADNTTVLPPGPGRKDCEHVEDEVPGVFTVSCTIGEVGTWYVFGHMRLAEDGATYNYWADPVPVDVRSFNLSVSGFPSAPVASGQNFTFTLNITGSDNVTSDHIGAHIFNASTTEPSVSKQVAAAVGSCTHAAGATEGTYTVTCSITNEGATPATFYVRGHLRITEDGVQTNFWSPEQTVSVLPAVL